jgi:hypothetical protein
MEMCKLNLFIKAYVNENEIIVLLHPTYISYFYSIIKFYLRTSEIFGIQKRRDLIFTSFNDHQFHIQFLHCMIKAHMQSKLNIFEEKFSVLSLNIWDMVCVDVCAYFLACVCTYTYSDIQYVSACKYIKTLFSVPVDLNIVNNFYQTVIFHISHYMLLPLIYRRMRNILKQLNKSAHVGIFVVYVSKHATNV